MLVIIDSSVAWNLLFVFTESESQGMKYERGYKRASVKSWLLEETGYEKRQTSMIKTTVLQFMLEAP